jgi:DNA polymerase-3 subunit chi
MTADVAFYHMTRSRADDTLPPLLSKTLAAEKRAVVCCEQDRFGQISTAIWSRQPDSWLPHGVSGKDEDAALCPIWLTDEAGDNANEAGFLFFLDGKTPEDLPEAERVFILFDGTDDVAVAAARERWKAFEAKGHKLSYWKQDEQGKWSHAQ